MFQVTYCSQNILVLRGHSSKKNKPSQNDPLQEATELHFLTCTFSHKRYFCDVDQLLWGAEASFCV